MIHLPKDRLELFTDRYLIDRLDGCVHQLHHPLHADVALTFDKPWEGAASFYHTVLYDEPLRVYRLYYRGWPIAQGRKEYDSPAVICLAESGDGITWRRPNLGLHEIDGSRDNNVLLTKDDGTHAFAPFIDRHPAARPNQRYKALGLVEGKGGLRAYASADGIRWSSMSPEPVLTKGTFDSQNVPFWSESERRYVVYYRTGSEAADPKEFKGKRTISRATSNDFLHWTDPVQMDFSGTPIEELYTNQTHPYYRAPHIYIALPKRFNPGRRTLTDQQAAALDIHHTQVQGVSDTVLMTSRGGTQYDRTFMESFIRPGPDPGNWGARSTAASCGVVQTSDTEMSLYVIRHYCQPTAYLERMTLRIDGFASVQGPYAGGMMTTRPFTFEGDDLVLNMSTSGIGQVRVAVLDETGAPLPHYSLDDCPPLYGDVIEKAVIWNDGRRLGALRGRAVRLRYELKDADVYSMRIR